MATTFTEEDRKKLHQPVNKIVIIDLTDDDDDDEDEDDNLDFDDEDDNDDDDEEDPNSYEAIMRAHNERVAILARRLKTEQIPLLIHEVLIKGNSRTKASLIKEEIQGMKNATTVQDFFVAASVADERLRRLGIFDSISITFDSGPPEVPGSAIVVVEVVEHESPHRITFGIFSTPESKSWLRDGSVKLKNLFGCGDIWDGSWAHGWDKTSEISTGVSLPRFKWLFLPLAARISLLPQDWLKLSSYKEQLLGLSVGLISTKEHDLSYDFTWRTLVDPSQISFRSIRSQLGHHLLSSLKYTLKFDGRDSSWRPTRGCALISTLQVGGLAPGSRSLQFVRQESDFRLAFPLGFANAALNFGVSAGIMYPWGRGFMNMASPLPERYLLGGNASPVCNLGGPAASLGSRSRGILPSEPRRTTVGNSSDGTASPERNDRFVDVAITAFADLSFNLPLKLFRDCGIYGHIFACAGNLSKLTELDLGNFSFRKYGESFRSSAGVGIIVPTKLFRMEVNYCCILKQLEHDQGKTGIQFSFISPLRR